MFHGDVMLLRTSQRHDGIPQQVPKGRIASSSSSINGSRGCWPNVTIYVDKSGEQERFRIVHEHKRGGRGPLDRTITATTLEKLYNEAVASDQREVVLR
jgi:hypothetical protein